MRTIRIATLLLLLGSLFAVGAARSQEPPPYTGGSDAAQAPPEAQAPPDNAAPPPDQGAPGEDPAAASVDYFHQQLSPYGQWVEREGYGMVWVPNAPPGWRPYTTGHWAYTDQGWAWVADEPWGWAPFHYGRWYYDADIGWGWVPGTVWAPAWVSWRSGGGYLGWAPLSPAIGFGFGVGVGLQFGGAVISPGFYTFCGVRDFLSPRIGGFIVPSARNVTIVQNTTVFASYTVVNNRIVNNGVSVQTIQQATGHPVPRITVAALATAGGPGGRGAFYQPPIVARAATVAHAEFGPALAAQVAVQRKSQAFAVVHAHSAATVAAIKSHGPAVTARTSARTSGGKGSPASGTAAQPGRYNVGVDETKRTTGSTGKASPTNRPPTTGSKAEEKRTTGGRQPTTGSKAEEKRTTGGKPPATGGKTEEKKTTPPPKATTPPPKAPSKEDKGKQEKETEHKPPPV
jgi:Family of unknown function (DUF6600)